MGRWPTTPSRPAQRPPPATHPLPRRPSRSGNTSIATDDCVSPASAGTMAHRKAATTVPQTTECGMKILISNDDGVQAPGLAALCGAVADLGEIRIAAP